MSLDTRLAAVREQLPAVRDYAYLNTGTYGPMPLACQQAMIGVWHYHQRGLCVAALAQRLRQNWPMHLGREGITPCAQSLDGRGAPEKI